MTVSGLTGSFWMGFHSSRTFLRFRGMGLLKVMEFKHNWNESAVREFYATLEVDMEDETFAWTTGRMSFATSFREFASLIGLDYEEMMTRRSMKGIPSMQEHETYIFYSTGEHQHGASKGLKRYPSLIFGTMSQTLMPKVGNSDVVRFPYYEVIWAILNGGKLDMVEWMVARMMECKLDRSGAMVYQPYITALIRSKTSLIGVDEILHKSF